MLRWTSSTIDSVRSTRRAALPRAASLGLGPTERILKPPLGSSFAIARQPALPRATCRGVLTNFRTPACITRVSTISRQTLRGAASSPERGDASPARRRVRFNRQHVPPPSNRREPPSQSRPPGRTAGRRQAPLTRRPAADAPNRRPARRRTRRAPRPCPRSRHSRPHRAPHTKPSPSRPRRARRRPEHPPRRQDHSVSPTRAVRLGPSPSDLKSRRDGPERC